MFNLWYTENKNSTQIMITTVLNTKQYSGLESSWSSHRLSMHIVATVDEFDTFNIMHTMAITYVCQSRDNMIIKQVGNNNTILQLNRHEHFSII